jgi:hypothetical protein
MKKLWQAKAMLGGVLVVCALASPSMASAASWGPLTTPHLLTSTNFRLDAHVEGTGVGGVVCTHASMPSVVRDGTRLTVTSATFANCHGTGLAGDCTPTLQSTNHPWTATGHSTVNVTIDGVRIVVQFENRPPPVVSCPVPSPVTVTGRLDGGFWSGATHQVHFSTDTGLTSHIPGFATPGIATATATLRDATQTLTLL